MMINRAVAGVLLSIAINFFGTESAFAIPAATKDKQPEPQKVPAMSQQYRVLDQFSNCKDAKAAGISNVPVPTGHTPPGWRRSADADNDGIACEKK